MEAHEATKLAHKIVNDWVVDYSEAIRKEITPAMRQHLVETIVENLAVAEPPAPASS